MLEDDGAFLFDWKERILCIGVRIDSLCGLVFPKRTAIREGESGALLFGGGGDGKTAMGNSIEMTTTLNRG